MLGLERFLSARPALAFAVCIIYYLLVVIPHNEVGIVVNDFFSEFSRAHYNLIVAGIFTALIILTLVTGWNNVNKDSPPANVGSYIIVTLLLFFCCFYFLMVVYVESVHLVQYAILAMLLFPIIVRYRSTMVWGVVLGALDELYQYLILENVAFYYDFNDVVLDAIGVGAGLLFLYIGGANSITRPSTNIFKRPEIYWPLGLTIILLIAWSMGHFSINYNYNDPAYFTLFKQPVPEGFWYSPPGPPARFHILTPIPAMLILISLIAFYGRLDGHFKH